MLKKNYSFLLALIIVVASSCQTKKLGSSTAKLDGNEIVVCDFEGYSQGITGLYSTDFGDFSFDELDEFVYNMATTKASCTDLYIVLQESREDRYGDNYFKNTTIGKVNVRESKKYNSYEYWKQDNSTEKMFWKDIEEYESKLNKPRGSSNMPSLVVRYWPKSIR